MERTVCPDLGTVQVVVLMGGLGTRLGQIGNEYPKAMAPVCGKPFFAYQMKLMRLWGFRKFLFLVGYRAGMVQEYFGNGADSGAYIRYVSDEGRQLGTAGAIRQALPMLEDDFLLIYGDSFMDVDFRDIVHRYAAARREGIRALMTVMENNNRFERSNASVAGGRVTLYDKALQTPEMRYTDYGINMFRKAVFSSLPKGKKIDLSEVQHRLSVEKQLGCCEVAHRFYEIGSPESLLEFAQYAKKRFGAPRPAVFLDRDGVINRFHYDEERACFDSPMNWTQFRMIERVPDAIRLLRERGFWVFVVTNQPAAAKGKTPLSALMDINVLMEKLLQGLGAEVDGVMACPHHPQGDRERGILELIGECDCRKPKPGMLLAFMRKYSIDPERSYMVGDSWTDVLAGRAVGVRTVLVAGQNAERGVLQGGEMPDMLVGDLYAFALGVKRGKEGAVP